MINNTLKTDEYITLPRIKKFCKENGMGSINLKDEGLAKIEKFASISKSNEDKVNKWIDSVAKEGIKYSFIRKINVQEGMFKSEVYWKEFINKEFGKNKMKRVNESKFTNDLRIQYVDLEKHGDGVIKAKFNIGLLVYSLKRTDDGYITDKVIYPIFVDLDIERTIFEIRLKSKSKIYKIAKDNGPLEKKLGKKVTPENMATEVINFLKQKISFQEETLYNSKDAIFKSYYKLLHSLTKTPQGIIDKINSKDKTINGIVRVIFSQLGLNTSKYSNMAKEDLDIWLEKYISLSEKNKDIFTENQDGYPIKLIATDSDDTRIEEISGNKEPLQTKPSYFDHKKILQKQKLCDGMSLAFNRKDTLYYGNQPFLVIIFYKNGFGVIRFPEYVEEEDIQNVLSRIIENF